MQEATSYILLGLLEHLKWCAISFIQRLFYKDNMWLKAHIGDRDAERGQAN